MNIIDEKKLQFLMKYNAEKTVDKAVSRAIAASVQHNSLYAPGISPEEKEAVRGDWRSFLVGIIGKYKNQQTVGEYECDFLKLQEQMNNQFAHAFYQTPHPKYKTDPGFRVAHAQKSLSVFLKHLWCMDEVDTPPQCPVDRVVLEIAGLKYDKAKWGYVNSIEEHRRKISQLISAKNDDQEPLAVWELKKFKP